jgi:hypothetical protein
MNVYKIEKNILYIIVIIIINKKFNIIFCIFNIKSNKN